MPLSAIRNRRSVLMNWHDIRDSFDHTIVPAAVRELWQGDSASLRLISQDYNIVYRFESGGRGYFLRICHPVLHSLPEARQVMGFLRFLAAEDVPVGVPVPSVKGAYIELLESGYYASAQTEAPGQEMTQHMFDISVYEAWGQSLGKFHAASRRFQPDPAIPYTFPTVQGNSGRISNRLFETLRPSCSAYMTSSPAIWSHCRFTTMV